MRMRKVAAILVPLVIAAGAAQAGLFKTENVQVVEGHTVFAAVERETNIEFAAVAGIAAIRTVVRGVLWFNDQELFSTTIAEEQSQGNFVLLVESADDDPNDHVDDAVYNESYQFVDPNERTWIVDLYSYDKCLGTLVLGQCAGAEETEPIFVVEIGPTAVDAAPANPLSPGVGAPTNKAYNFVTLVRLDALDATVADGKAHPSPADGTLAGDSHDTQATPVGAHGHDTASVDLWFALERPPAPAARTFLFVDAVGAAAAFHPHP